MRAIDDRLREDNERRVERMNAWIEMAEGSDHDHVRFVFYWIAYEAAYQSENSKLKEWKERQAFHGRLAQHDRGRLRGILRTQRKTSFASSSCGRRAAFSGRGNPKTRM